MYVDSSFILKNEVPLPFEILVRKRCCGGRDAFLTLWVLVVILRWWQDNRFTVCLERCFNTPETKRIESAAGALPREASSWNFHTSQCIAFLAWENLVLKWAQIFLLLSFLIKHNAFYAIFHNDLNFVCSLLRWTNDGILSHLRVIFKN
jgi:hypothetical protein